VLDLKELRKSPEVFVKGLGRRGIPASAVEEVLSLDERVRQAQAKAESLRSEVKKLSAQVAEAMRAGDAARAEELRARSRALGEEQARLGAEARDLASELQDRLARLPNLPAPECPDGASESENVVVQSSEPLSYEAHQRVPHWVIGEELDVLDFERAAKLSGSMFSCYKKAAARLVRALSAWALDRHSPTFEEMRPPSLVRSEVMYATGHLPKFSEEAYHMERDDLWAIPTAEVPLTSWYRDEVLAHERLPVLLTALTPCFRREAGAAGKETRGLLRVHEFEKVEILALCTPDQAAQVHDLLLSQALGLVKDLGLEWRVVDLCAGELGQSARRTFDIEVYAPGSDMWLEVSSVSWFGDYQARRANLRYRTPRGELAFLHTLNGSALAWPRVVAALLEVGRQQDGTVVLPQVLSSYLGGRTVIGPEGNLC
jgi:seryl-tRNA synthetase